MKGIIHLGRLIVYGYIVYQTYFVNMWIAVGLGVCFTSIELGFFLLGYVKQQVDALGFAQSQAINTDFGFSSKALTTEECDLVDQIRGGDLVASVSFLKGRCQNQLINFNLLPEPVRLLLAQRLINAINRGESPTWSELLTEETEVTNV